MKAIAAFKNLKIAIEEKAARRWKMEPPKC
jgi:hypothetical protein